MPPQSYSFHSYSPPEFPLISGPEGILNLASEFGYVFLKSYPVFILYISNISGKRDFSMTSITFDLEVPPLGPPTPIVEPPGSLLSLHSPPWTPMSLTKSYCCSEPPLLCRSICKPSCQHHLLLCVQASCSRGAGRGEAFFHYTLSNSEMSFLLIFLPTPLPQMYSLRTRSLPAHLQ